MTWAAASVSAFGVLALLVWAQRRRSTPAVWPAWHAALESRRLEPYEDVERSFADSHGALVDTLNFARQRAEENNPGEAQRVMVCAADHVARHTPDVAKRLTVWRAVGQAVRALRPLPRLKILRFRDWRLRGAAVLERCIRWALDASHGFALRIWVLLKSLSVVSRGFVKAARPSVPVPSEAPAPQDVDARLRHMEALGEDLASLHHASLDTYKALIDSLRRSDQG